MTKNNNEQYATKTLRAHDLVSGQELLVAFFPEAGVVTINGWSVTRTPEHEDKDGQAVFHRAMDNKLFTVDMNSLRKLYT